MKRQRRVRMRECGGSQICRVPTFLVKIVPPNYSAAEVLDIRREVDVGVTGEQRFR